MLAFLDILFFILHILIILFNLTGWIWKRTRKLHFWVVVATLVSWLLLGIWYGLGYCFLTDWHWQVKRKLGEFNLPNSFVQYLFERIGISILPETTDLITIISFVLAILLSIYFNYIRKN